MKTILAPFVNLNLKHFTIFFSTALLFDYFGMNFESYYLSRTNQPVRLTLKDICIGIISSECPLLNYLLLIGKLYLRDCRRSNKLPDIAGFKVKVNIKYLLYVKFAVTKFKSIKTVLFLLNNYSVQLE